MKHVLRGLRRFLKGERGDVNVEAMLIVPALFVVFAAGWTFFDVFRQQSISQKSNYMIGDALSREIDAVDPEYIDNAQAYFQILTKDDGGDSSLRVTVVRWNEANGLYQMVWSEARGQRELNQGDMLDYADRLPVLAHLDHVILVETWDMYEPIFAVGLASTEIRTYSFTRPRNTPQLLHVTKGLPDPPENPTPPPTETPPPPADDTDDDDDVWVPPPPPPTPPVLPPRII